jgi:hypothetical protein
MNDCPACVSSKRIFAADGNFSLKNVKQQPNGFDLQPSSSFFCEVMNLNNDDGAEPTVRLTSKTILYMLTLFRAHRTINASQYSRLPRISVLTRLTMLSLVYLALPVHMVCLSSSWIWLRLVRGKF